MEYAIGRFLGHPAIAYPLWIGFVVWLVWFGFSGQAGKVGQPTAADLAWRPRELDGRRGFDDILAVGAVMVAVVVLALTVLLWLKGAGVNPRDYLEKGPTG